MLGVAAPVSARRGAAPQYPATIVEDFVMPEWLAAIKGQVAASGNDGSRALLAALQQDRVTFGRIKQIDGHVISVLPAPGVELFAPDQARDMAMLVNDRLAGRATLTGNRIPAFATLSAFDPHVAREAERAIGKLHLSGLALGANRGKRLDHRSLWDLFAFAQAASVPVYLPVSYAPGAGDRPYRALGAAGILAGASLESARHSQQLIFGGVLDAFPKLTVILARLGEAATYWHAELVETYAVRKAAGASLPQRSIDDYFETNIRLTTADMETALTIETCRQAAGEGGLFGSATCPPVQAWRSSIA
ncbi:MAG: amidohydrolase family protein [Janthinobacterium lividum]